MHVNVNEVHDDDRTNVLYLQGAAGTPGLDVSLLYFLSSLSQC